MNLRRILPSVGSRTTPIQVGHRYKDTITGERIDIVTVGAKTTVERLDADRRPENSVTTNSVRAAIDAGVLVHDPETCPACTNVSSR